MFSKAKVKRFNDEVGCAPAPNAYDAKIPVAKKSGLAVSTSRRFVDPKDETPGPGQYLTVPNKSVRASPQILKRSTSFRINSLTKADSRTDLSRNEIFKTPVSTPRRLRRSISTGNVTINQSPSLNKDAIAVEGATASELAADPDEVSRLRCRVAELEQQLEDAMEKLLVSEDSVVVQCEDREAEKLRARVEQLEAELETGKVELRLRDEDRQRADKLSEELDSLKVQCDYAYTLKSENELLNQDIQTLEEELTKSKEERDKIESELEEMRKTRKDLDAKNVFLHFTQEQLNAQVLSLEQVVKNLKTENHLLNKGIKNLVEQIQAEKKKFDELSEQYNAENADAEIEFKNLELEMEENKIKYKSLEIELRAKLGEAEFEKCELKKDIEVIENDKSVLKDQLEVLEKSINGLTLDLGEVCKDKEALSDENKIKSTKIEKLEEKNNEYEKKLKAIEEEKESLVLVRNTQVSEIEHLQKANKELENDLKEVDMSKVGLEGANAALGEEVVQLEKNLNELKNRNEVLESEKEKSLEELNDLKISKQEVEESLLDTQGLVEAMEIKMMDAHTKHRDEAAELADNLKKASAAHENLKEERANLLEINTALSGQVTEALHSIHNLQVRESTLQQELVMVKQFMEAAQVEGEEDRIRMMQAEDEILSLTAEMEEVCLQVEDAEVRFKQAASEVERLRGQNEQLTTEIAGVREDSRQQLNTLKTAYNSAVAELTESKEVGRQLLDQMSGLEDDLQAKKEENSKILKDFEERNEEALNEMDKMVQGFEQEKGLLHDKINHLENLRDNLEKTVSEKTEAIHSQKVLLDDSIKNAEFSLNKIEEVTKTNLRLKGNLELRATENLKQKDIIDTLKKEVEDYQNKSESHLVQIKELSEQKADTDRLRMAEMEMCIKLREKLTEAEKGAEAGESAVRSMEAQQIIVMEAEAKLEEEKVKGEDMLLLVNKLKERSEEMETLMSQMDERNEELEAEMKGLKEMIEPFKEQLEGFEIEKKSLLSSNEASKEEVSKLSNQYSALLGHQNHKQKVKHVVQLKQENVSLKSKVEALQLDLSKAQKAVNKWEQRYNEVTGLKKFDPRMSFQPTPRNKENFQTPVVNVKESRKSTGSPLARVNK